MAPKPRFGADRSLTPLSHDTGKALLSQGIHARSRRVARHFVGVNIAAIAYTLLEAEFLGMVGGA